ncbi:hypothetical protein WICPIJ_008850 [Wickerhamomyces pijperi]|uniref:Histone deacetylase complex subunit SAP30 Sin3 binding domain-containing protein n=1 Tax=Wickerhamomyces pijperi TaxID=599730 RepID=A0A9P8PVD8_WICPI|nr:hypothetical protein WICPIJ_008850 [Wickerhamomyces pijperi]
MPPKSTNRDNTVSDTESKTSNSRSNAKARNSAAQQAQAELLARHIHANGPNEKPIIEPLDFDSLPVHTLRKYRDHYGLSGTESCLTGSGYILQSKAGEKTYTAKNSSRVSKLELAANVKKHFLSTNVKESEVITNFLYRVNNQDKQFKLNFGKQ